jgi:hypothetical protein
MNGEYVRIWESEGNMPEFKGMLRKTMTISTIIILIRQKFESGTY